MMCLVCRQAELVDGITSMTLERDETRLVVNAVPARVCPSCGDAYVGEETAVELLRSAQQMFEAGVQDEVREYEALGD
ncbi:MAG: type II toxin-antitoxin system MqsA family antitoxin [Chloroflexi bacterium]|nr:type II toxin-antitoxin system MqsA family antitoxin [Chloroflexota bacterium]